MNSLLDVCTALDNCKLTNSRTNKLDILGSLEGESRDILRDLLCYTYDPYTHYWAYPRKCDTFDPSYDFDNNRYYSDSSILWNDFKGLLLRLSSREVTGNDAAGEITYLLSKTPQPYHHWLSSILRRDLSCGINLGSINKLFPGSIKPLECALADKYAGQEPGEDDDWCIEPKFDGIRGIIIPDSSGRLMPVSRSNKPLYNNEHILSHLQEVFGGDYVLDGEFYASNHEESWNLSMSICKTKSEHPDRLKLKFHVFDIISVNEFKDQYCLFRLRDRQHLLRKFMEPSPSSYIEVVDSMPVNSSRVVPMLVDNFIHEGYEGGVIKDLNALYEYGRGSAWLKCKQIHDEDYIIASVNIAPMLMLNDEGIMVKTETVTSLGFHDEHGNVGNVGSGLTNEMRNTLHRIYKSDQYNVVGKYVEVEFQERSKNGCPRFPVFRRFREDK